ncbi:cell division protein FtsW [Rhodococcus sp. AG1013]|uniref:putative lipid II flippase FtsW n=1 Tax=Rhodococcus sp. AG1013 TaxID=2183996 RepID=UPI000E2B907C|nr:putative lipid II flippase FtsW [Rhodococcus sp. AG1013]RDI23171.1 cell division protein FtsW [Rhodococcus sp. AG1013]
MWSERPLFDFHVILSVTALLVTVGLTMVLSSSSVESFVSSGSPYARFIPQAIYAAIGLVAFVAIVRVSTRTIRALAPWLLGIAGVLLVLVLIPGIGVEQMGARSWFVVGGISFQPSEFAKVALAIWCAHLLATYVSAGVDVNKALKPLALVSVLVMALVVLQRDLGTMITIGIILMAMLWFGGFRTSTVAAITISGGVASLVLGLTAGYRSDRIKAFMNPTMDPQGLNYQTIQAKYALASGGVFGKGLGQSDAKWSYLPQSHNDFIFAVIGEELGFLGAFLIIVLFAIVLLIGMRISQRSTDPFLRILAAASTTWIVLQAFINIAYVVGLVPVTGLQLPLISAGGTSMITTMMMFGFIAHAALREPEALVSLNGGGSRWMRTVFGRPVEPPKARPARRARAPRTPTDSGRTTRRPSQAQAQSGARARDRADDQRPRERSTARRSRR